MPTAFEDFPHIRTAMRVSSAGGFGRVARGGRARRGDVRAAIVALLAERPMHGYEIIQELASARTVSGR